MMIVRYGIYLTHKRFGGTSPIGHARVFQAKRQVSFETTISRARRASKSLREIHLGNAGRSWRRFWAPLQSRNTRQCLEI